LIVGYAGIHAGSKLTREEREYLERKLSRLMEWVGVWVPDEIILDGKKVRLHDVVWNIMLPDLLASFGDLNYDIVEMVLADQECWDRYEAAKWLTMRRWLEANPNDDFAKDIRAKLTLEPKRYAAYTRIRRIINGWGG
jgi:hypothetical protein